LSILTDPADLAANAQAVDAQAISGPCFALPEAPMAMPVQNLSPARIAWLVPVRQLLRSQPTVRL